MTKSAVLTCDTCSCGIPLFANSHVATCKHCQTRRKLNLNPRIIGTMVDETGCLEKAKLAWNPQAWMELIFPGATPMLTTQGSTQDQECEESVTSQILTRISTQGLQSVKEAEDLLQQARITVTFGWARQFGRLCVLRVEW